MLSGPAKIAREAWGLRALATSYRGFLDRWSAGAFGELDALSQRTRMTAEWLLLIRRDPRLPPAPLPPEWPGVRAQEMFRTLQAELIGPADELAAAWLATIADAGAQHPSANV